MNTADYIAKWYPNLTKENIVNPFVQRNLDCAQYAQSRGSQYEGPEPEMRDIDDMPLLLDQPQRTELPESTCIDCGLPTYVPQTDNHVHVTSRYESEDSLKRNLLYSTCIADCGCAGGQFSQRCMFTPSCINCRIFNNHE